MTVKGGYAEGTGVAVDRSRAEIERTLRRFGAQQFIYGWDADSAVIGFMIAGRQVKLTLPLPRVDDPQFAHGPSGRRRTDSAREAAWEQACRERWRVMALAVKAKLAMIEAGITTIEHEFLADIMLPDGGTFGRWALPQLDRIYSGGQMPPLLPWSREED